jgi:hypothetical protein
MEEALMALGRLVPGLVRSREERQIVERSPSNEPRGDELRLQ